MKSYIILDRSGSMSTRWSDVSGTLQHYIDGLPAGTKTTLLAFDTDFDFVWNELVKPDVTSQFRQKSIAPRGGTALMDAIGRMNGEVLSKAKKKAQIVILTDGWENSSKEITKPQASKIVQGWKDKNYDVVFLGADFDAFGEASGLGISRGSTMSYNTVNAAEVGATMGLRASSYHSGVATQSLDFTEEEREKASKGEKTS